MIRRGSLSGLLLAVAHRFVKDAQHGAHDLLIGNMYLRVRFDISDVTLEVDKIDIDDNFCDVAKGQLLRMLALHRGSGRLDIALSRLPLGVFELPN